MPDRPLRVDCSWEWTRIRTALNPLRVTGEPSQGEIRGVCLDSRVARRGDLFFALPGERTDGHRYVAAAAEQGCVGAVVARAPAPPPPDRWPCLYVDGTVAALGRLARHYLDDLPCRVVAVTGSVGKTTTKTLAAAVLAEAFRVRRAPGNWNTELGVPLVVLSAGPEDQILVLEFSMTGLGDIAHLARVAPPVVGVVTRVAESHLEHLGSLERVARAKAELVEALPNSGWAVLNADDERVAAMAARTAAQICRYGLARPSGEGLAVYAEGLDVSPEGSRFRLHLPGGSYPCRLRLPGGVNVSNALAAAAVGVVLGLRDEQVLAGLTGAEAVPMRLNIHPGGGGRPRVIDDSYNASPTSTVAALEVLAAQPGARRVALLGDMLELGPDEAAGHRRVGRAAARLGVDVLVAVGPRMQAAAQAFHEAAPARRVEWVEDVEALLPRLTDWIAAEDVVLVKGSRGMTMERAVAALRSQ